jgi:hypothetical protein
MAADELDAARKPELGCEWLRRRPQFAGDDEPLGERQARRKHDVAATAQA